MEVFLQKERNFSRHPQLAQPFLAPELRAINFTDTRLFMNNSLAMSFSEAVFEAICLDIGKAILGLLKVL